MGIRSLIQSIDEKRVLKNGLIAIRKGYQWGLMDQDSNVLMPMVFDYISTEDDNLWARFQGHKFFINESFLGSNINEQRQLPFSYDFMTHDIRLHLIIGIRNIVFKSIVNDSFNTPLCNNHIVSTVNRRLDILALNAAVKMYHSTVTIVGDVSFIKELCLENNIDIDSFQIIHTISHSKAISIGFNLANNKKTTVFLNGFSPMSCKELISGIVDIYNDNGQILFHGLSFESLKRDDSDYCNGYLNLKIGENQFIYKDNKLIVSSNTYDEVGSFNIKTKRSSILTDYYCFDVGYALVRRGTQYGVINCDGELKVPLIYDMIDNLGCVDIDPPSIYKKPAFLIAKNKSSIDFYLADKNLMKLPYGYISSEYKNNTFIVTNANLPIELTVEQLADYIYDNELKDVYFGIIDTTGRELIPCSNSINTLINLTNYKNIIYKEELSRKNKDCVVATHILSWKTGLLDNFNRPLCGFIYDSISDFNEDGIAKVRNKEGEGLISKTGEIILPCIYRLYINNGYNSPYESIPEFTEGLLTVSLNDAFGLIDKSGHFIVPCKYPRFKPFSNTYQIELLKQGFVIVGFEDVVGLVKITKPNEYYLDYIYKEIYLYNKLCDNKESLNKYIIAKGNNNCKIRNIETDNCVFEVNNITVVDVCIITESYIVICVSINEIQIYQIYSIAKQKVIAEYQSIETWMWNGQYISVCRKDKWGCFDLMNGVEIIPCEYDEQISIPKTKDNIVVVRDGKYGYIDINNKIIIDFIYDDAKPLSEGLAAVKYNGQWSFITISGEVIAGGFEDVLNFSEGFAAVKRNEKWGFIDTKGNLAIPHRFADVGSFHDGLAAAAYKKRWGYIDKHNRNIIPFDYTYAGDFVEGLAEVGDYDGSGTISKHGYTMNWKNYPRSFNDDSDYERDTWDALTDGQYGDMPDDFDGDYSFLGY